MSGRMEHVIARVMVHRVILGAIERFLGVLIEHYAGAFPTWLAPVQAILLTVTDAHHHHAVTVREKLDNLGLRVELDDRNEKLGYKIREAQAAEDSLYARDRGSRGGGGGNRPSAEGRFSIGAHDSRGLCVPCREGMPRSHQGTAGFGRDLMFQVSRNENR